MVQFDKNIIVDRNDDELIEMITDSDKYITEAVELARAELIKRGVRIPTVEICSSCGKHYWSTPALFNRLCKKCDQQKTLAEQQIGNKQVLDAVKSKEENWMAAIKNGQVIKCSVKNPRTGGFKGDIITPERIIASHGYFKKAEIGVIGKEILLRTVLDSVYDHDVVIPLQEIDWASCKVLGRAEHIMKRMLHFLGLGGGIGTVSMIVMLFQKLAGKSIPLPFFLLLAAGPLLGGAVLGMLIGLATGRENEVTLATTSGTLVVLYVKKEQLRILHGLLDNAHVKWK